MTAGRKRLILAVVIAPLVVVACLLAVHFTPGQWSGVDETVIEKFAEQAGRSAQRPLIDTDQGDLLLFVFLLAGTVGGFVLGYTFRGLFAPAKTAPEGSNAPDA
jgi:ABC-type cobalt transport system substrate-binding protein